MDTLIGALKSKTVWWNVIGLVGVILASDQIKTFIDPTHLLEIQAIVNLLLRFVTSQPLAIK